MKHFAGWKVLPVVVVLVLGAMFLGVNAAGDEALAQEAPVEAVELWFIEMTGAPVADGGNLRQVRAEKASFVAAAKSQGIAFQERYSYDTLFNGLSVRARASDVNRLASLPGVKAVYPVITATPDPVTEETGPEMWTALAQTGADIAHSSLGLTGAGVKVGIIDSGVNYHHPDLGGCFGPGCKVAYGWDFVGDFFSAQNNPNPDPDADPDDCAGRENLDPNLSQSAGHGTHVAGITAANGDPSSGQIRGVAPGATLGAYRVFGCSGSTTVDIMLAAMERALADGMDVVNMSIGSAFQWPQYPTAAAADRLVNRGVVVVASIGNSGVNGVYAASAPGVGSKVIGVASFNNTHSNAAAFSASPDNTLMAYNQGTAAGNAPTSGTNSLARTGTQTSTADACNVGGVSPLAPNSLDGKVALIRRGTCAFHEKSLNAQNAGADGVVIYNNVAGIQSITVAGTPAITIPVVSISQADGNLLDTRLAGGPVNITWGFHLSTPLNPLTAGMISSFSSYGLAPDLSLKPDLGAPGGSIRSTYPLAFGGYAVVSGTSMSSPHTAGAVALLLEARPKTNSQVVRSILQNTAVPRPWQGNPPLGFLDQAHRQGAGMLQIDKAILATTLIEPGKLSLGESEAGPQTRTLSIRNGGSEAVTYDLSHSPALATGGSTFANPQSAFASFATVAFSAASVTVPAGGTATVDATITAPDVATGRQYGGYIVFTPQGGGQVYRVPYAGFVGDYQSILVLNPAANANGNPLLRPSLTFGPSVPVAINPDNNEVAWLILHLDHAVRRLRVEIRDANTGQQWHRALDLEYWGRNSTATAFTGFAFDGTTVNGRRVNVLPNGQYVMVLTVEKALADSSNPAHFETWTSPVITIARP